MTSGKASLRMFCGAVVVAVALLTSAPAVAASLGDSSAKRVCVFRFAGPGATTLRAAVMKILGRKVAIYPRTSFLAVATRIGVPRTSFTKPAALAKVARAAKLDFIVKGAVRRKKGKGTFLTVRALDAGGKEVWSGVLRVRAGRLGPAAARLRDQLLPLLLRAAPAVEPEPPPPALDPGPVVVLEGVGGKKKKEPRLGPPFVTARAGGALLVRNHQARSTAFVSNREDLCRGFLCFEVLPYYAVVVELDIHPGALSRNRVAGLFGLAIRYTHGFLPASYESMDPSTGAVVPMEIPVAHRELSVAAHADVSLGHRLLPHLVPRLGFGLLDLHVGPNPLELRSLLYPYAWAGLQLRQSLVPELLGVSLGGDYRLAFAAGSDAARAYGNTGALAATGFGLEAGAYVTPLPWLEVSVGWSLQWLRAAFSGVGESGFEGVTVIDRVHTVYLTAGARVP